MLLLDPTGSGALTDSGSGSITVNGNGAVVVDSSNATAAVLSGSGKVVASDIDVTGGTKATGSGKFAGTVDHEAPIADPLGLSLPPAPSTTFAAVNYSGRTTLTLSPGTYVGGIKINGSGSVVLRPGVYYLKGGGLAVTGSGSISGTGVLLLNAPSASTDSIRLTSSGSMTLTPSTSLTGAYAAYNGIAVLQDPASSVPISITGSGSMNLAGIVYAPKAQFVLSSSGKLVVNADATYGRAEVIVADVKDTGSGSVVVNPPWPTVTIGTPVPTSVPGEPVPFVIRVSDTSSTAQSAKFGFTISFGDGDTATLTGTSPLLVDHAFTQTGTYVVQVTATDEFGNTSAVAKQTILVASVVVETNPFNRTQTALFVGGTSGNDTVNFAPSGKNGIAVTLDGKSEGTFTTSGPLIVFGEGGSDTIQESSALKNQSFLLQTMTADNLETDLDNEALQWAGLSAAVEILNA